MKFSRLLLERKKGLWAGCSFERRAVVSGHESEVEMGRVIASERHPVASERRSVALKRRSEVSPGRDGGPFSRFREVEEGGRETELTELCRIFSAHPNAAGNSVKSCQFCLLLPVKSSAR